MSVKSTNLVKKSISCTTFCVKWNYESSLVQVFVKKMFYNNRYYNYYILNTFLKKFFSFCLSKVSFVSHHILLFSKYWYFKMLLNIVLSWTLSFTLLELQFHFTKLTELKSYSWKMVVRGKVKQFLYTKNRL